MFEENVFALNDDEYKQDIDPIKEYISQSALFLSKNTDMSLDQAKEFVLKQLKESKTKINPTVHYTEKDQNGDKTEQAISLSDYLYNGLKNNRIFAPTFTTYYHPSEKRSFIAQKVIHNIKRRYASKKQEFEALANQQHELAVIKNGEQTNFKLKNNAFSGAFVSIGNPFYNPSAHSTLTSVTRSTSSLANANNEKLLSGNRHYWSSLIVYNNITFIISKANLDEIDKVIKKFNLKYPTPQDALECILWSTRLYWSSSEFEKDILEYLNKLKPVELAAFVYSNDFYHIKKLNEDFAREFIDRLSFKKCDDSFKQFCNTDNALEVVKNIPDDILNLVHQIFNDEVKGLGKKYDEMQKLGILDHLVSTAVNIYSHITIYYKDFIKAFFVNNNLPASVAFFPKSIRRSAITSDTDSTIFTVMDWIKWYFGEYVINSRSIAVAGVLVFLSSQTIYHILSILSSNLNFEKSELHRLAMKNEFRFDVFIPTQVSKHYYAQIGCREGNVFKEYEDEIKGVHLKNSNLPKDINKKAKLLMERIMQTTINNEKISLRSMLEYVRDIETEIYNSLIKGESDFYRSFKLKYFTSYKLDKEKSPYLHHIFWKDVFESKYGIIEEPPYTCIKLSTTLHNKTSIIEYLSEIEDLNIRDKFQTFINTYNKTSFNTIMLSKSFVNQYGVPLELIPLINTNKTILDVCNVFYIILETLGYYKKPNVILRDLF